MASQPRRSGGGLEAFGFAEARSLGASQRRAPQISGLSETLTKPYYRAVPNPSQSLQSLAGRIRSVETRKSAGAVPSGWGRDLARGALHEWFAATPPLCVLAHLAWQALEERQGRVLWIGRRVWPYPRALVRDFGVRAGNQELELARLPRADRPDDANLLLHRSLFVDAPRPASRLWAVDVALRCPAVTAVVADASGLDMAATRRLQLAAEAGRGFGLLARPPREERELSAAATRWRVKRAPAGAAGNPRWSLRLLRAKSVLGYGEKALEPCLASSR